MESFSIVWLTFENMVENLMLVTYIQIIDFYKIKAIIFYQIKQIMWW